MGVLLTKLKIYHNRQKGKVTNITEIKYELWVLLEYEQYHDEIERKLPIFEQKMVRSYSHFRAVLQILSDVD